MRYIRIFLTAVFIIPALFVFSSSSFAADMDDLYQPLFKRNRFFIEEEGYYYQNRRRAFSTNQSQGKIELDPYIFALKNNLTFSPYDNIQLKAMFNDTFPSSFHEFVYSNQGWDGKDRWVWGYSRHLSYFYDIAWDAKVRTPILEISARGDEKMQKGDWYTVTQTTLPVSYQWTYLDTRFEDYALGLKFLPEPKKDHVRAGLAALDRPLLDKGQYNIEADFRYREGKMKRTAYYGATSSDNQRIYQILKPHLTTTAIMRSGLWEGT